jgi:GDP-L-fucose synthase
MSNKEIVLITGGSGLVGHAIREICKDHEKVYEFIFIDSKVVDLRDEKTTIEYISNVKPTFVIHLAGNVGDCLKI